MISILKQRWSFNRSKRSIPDKKSIHRIIDRLLGRPFSRLRLSVNTEESAHEPRASFGTSALAYAPLSPDRPSNHEPSTVGVDIDIHRVLSPGISRYKLLRCLVPKAQSLRLEVEKRRMAYVYRSLSTPHIKPLLMSVEIC